jgi:hypothetical protein
MRAVLLSLCLFAAPLAARADATPPAVRAEIDALLGRMVASACEFNRNGSWYPATEARSHLLMKLNYIENHGTLASSEQFIDLAASGSSFSGKPYLVKCGTAAPVESKVWLTGELKSVRAAKPAGAK